MIVDEIRTAPAGPRMDKLVAELVMGQVWQGGHPIPNYDGRWSWPAPYSTDIAAAWEVVERLAKTHRVLVSGGIKLPWQCDVMPHPFATPTFAEAETAPLAICRVALLTVSTKELAA